ncbi:hypothetical protein P2S50_24265, partial [Escherichia coli]
DRNRSHWSTSKTPSYTKSVSWQHHLFTHICQLVALITIGLLFIGVLNAPINTYEMVIYPIAFFVCLFGQMRLFRSA